MTQILHPSVIEDLCRRTFNSNKRHSLIAVRVALQASIDHGSKWFSVRDVFNQLGGVSKKLSSPAYIADRLELLGVASKRLISLPNYSQYEAQLKCSMVDTKLVPGQKSQKIRDAVEKYYQGHPKATPLIALLLIGIYLYGVHKSNELGQFLLPEFDLANCQSTPGRLLNKLSDKGLLAIHRTEKSLSRPFIVYPV